MFKIVGGVGIGLTIFSHYNHPFPLKNPITSFLLDQVARYDHSYSQKLLEYMIWSQFFFQPSLKDKHLGNGLDLEASYLQQLQILGCSGVQIGPISYHPSLDQQSRSHLGILYAKSNIRSHFVNNPGSNFCVGINVKPDEDVLKSAPYLLHENILNTMQELCIETPLKYIVLSLVRVQDLFKEHPTEVLGLKNAIKKECQRLCKEHKVQVSIYIETKKGREKVNGKDITLDGQLTANDFMKYLKS